MSGFNFNFGNKEILKVIRSLSVNNAYGSNDFSIRLLKTCDSAVVKPFPNIWKKSSIFPVYSKGNKLIAQNYRPVSLQPIFGKTFERIKLTQSLSFLMKTSFLLQISLVVVLLIHVSINSYQLFIFSRDLFRHWSKSNSGSERSIFINS